MQQAITWEYADSDVCHHMESLGHNELITHCNADECYELQIYIYLSLKTCHTWAVKLTAKHHNGYRKAASKI